MIWSVSAPISKGYRIWLRDSGGTLAEKYGFMGCLRIPAVYSYVVLSNAKISWYICCYRVAEETRLIHEHDVRRVTPTGRAHACLLPRLRNDQGKGESVVLRQCTGCPSCPGYQHAFDLDSEGPLARMKVEHHALD